MWKATDKIRVPKIRITSTFFLRAIWTPQTRYAGRRMIAKSIRISKTPTAFQNGTLRRLVIEQDSGYGDGR